MKLREGSHNHQLARDLLRGKRITQLDALAEYGCMRLPSRIHELRSAGYAIETEEIVTSTGKRIARYFIKKANR